MCSEIVMNQALTHTHTESEQKTSTPSTSPPATHRMPAPEASTTALLLPHTRTPRSSSLNDAALAAGASSRTQVTATPTRAASCSVASQSPRR